MADMMLHGATNAALGWCPSRATDASTLIGMSSGNYRRVAAGATAGLPPCIVKQVSRPIRNREAPVNKCM
jgi:hypothetical protein